MEPAPTLRYEARRDERRALTAAAFAIPAVAVGVLHPLAAVVVVLAIVALAVGMWHLSRRRAERGWYAIGVAIALQVAVLSIWIVGMRTIGEVAVAVAVAGLLPAIPLLLAFTRADRARAARRLAWGQEVEERRQARTYSRLTVDRPVSADDEWVFADRALEQHEDELAYLDRAATAAPRPATSDEIPDAARLVGMTATVTRTVSPDGIGTGRVVHRDRWLDVPAYAEVRVPAGLEVLICGAHSPRALNVRPKGR
ncbi:MAG: hypothetical protein KY437_00220 [Actinobacteria bacterium]|nr:hypothetical protein [Actinomycetota bacterium]